MKNNSNNENKGEIDASIDKNNFRMLLMKNDSNQVRLITDRAYKIKLNKVFDTEMESLLNNIR
jgi:hypothetical protein